MTGILRTLQELEQLHSKQDQILDQENRDYVNQWYAKLNGYETISLSSVDKEKITMLYEETFLK